MTTTPEESFQAHRDEIGRLLTVIGNRAASNFATSDSTLHWGNVGSAAHVREKLEEIVAFLGPVPTYRSFDREGRPIRVTIPDSE